MVIFGACYAIKVWLAHLADQVRLDQVNLIYPTKRKTRKSKYYCAANLLKFEAEQLARLD